MRSRGTILLLVLVFGSIFFVVLASLASFVIAENRAQNLIVAKAKSFAVAEAGLNYYAWFLAHFPDDFQNGTGQAGPYVIPYTDSTGAAAGTYTLSIAGSSACGSTQMVDITSEGVASDFPGTTSRLVGRYGAQTVAQYNEVIDNGSITGINFDDLQPDFDNLQAIAEAQGIFLPRNEVPQSPHYGYHLVFNSDATVTITLVMDLTTLKNVRPADGSANYINDYTLIAAENPHLTLTIPEDCGLIYSEANTWIEGTIPRKMTLAVANGSGQGAAPDVIIVDDIDYTTTDGSVGLTVLGAHNVLIAPNAPTDLSLRGIFVAVEGIFGRNNYYSPSGGCGGLYENRDELEIVGTVVSSLPIKTNWPNGCGGGVAAGYATRSIALDPTLATNPPPFTPAVSGARSFISWYQDQ
jgi:hypothetical protein